MSDLRDSELRDYDNLLRDYHAVVAARDQALRELGEARDTLKRAIDRENRLQDARDAALRSNAELTRERDAIRAELSSDRRAWQNFIDETAAQRDFAIMDMLAAQKSTAELRGALENPTEETPNKEMTADEWAADPDVQLVYKILCDTTEPPEERHCEGWMAERIVLAARAIKLRTALASSSTKGEG